MDITVRFSMDPRCWVLKPRWKKLINFLGRMDLTISILMFDITLGLYWWKFYDKDICYIHCDHCGSRFTDDYFRRCKNKCPECGKVNRIIVVQLMTWKTYTKFRKVHNFKGPDIPDPLQDRWGGG